MFGTATGARLRELSVYGRFAKLWVRFKGDDLGSRWTLETDEEFDPIRDLAKWIPAAPSHNGGDAIKGLDDAIQKATSSMENNFAGRIAAPLDLLFSWDKLGEAIAGSLQRL
eukprot:6684416-Pyramimonas_sp.AAC.1